MRKKRFSQLKWNSLTCEKLNKKNQINNSDLLRRTGLSIVIRLVSLCGFQLSFLRCNEIDVQIFNYISITSYFDRCYTHTHTHTSRGPMFGSFVLPQYQYFTTSTL